MATSVQDSCYTIVHQDNSADAPSLQDIRNSLEKGSDNVKIETMRRILAIMLNGDPMPNQLLMHVIRFVMPSKNKVLKKLLHFYWEACTKTQADGKTLLQEMVLVINAIRNDLQHPNEYIRGATLRFLTKIQLPELLEPLLPTARQCLEHRHSYVRKNAVFAIYSIYLHSENLVPDAPELIANFLAAEGDSSCRRNAFLALCAISPERVVQWLEEKFDNITGMETSMQMAVIEFIRKDSLTNAQNRSRYLKVILDLLESQSSTVVYEAATALTALTNNPVAIKAAASKFIELVVKESDNNVKLIVLDRIDNLRRKHERTLDDLVMDVLRVLSSPDIDVRKKALDIALEMVSSRNVEEVIQLLKKELTKTIDEAYEKNNEYRQLLIHTIHQCAIRFSEVASSVVHVLMECIGEFNSASAVDVIAFVKEVVEKFPALRSAIIAQLMSTLSEVRANKVYRGALWIVGEYCTSETDVREAWRRIRTSLGEIPILASEQRLLDVAANEAEGLNGDSAEVAASSQSSRKVLADGTYATEGAITSDSAKKTRLEAVKKAQKPPLRQLILDGDYYLASILSATLVKLVMRYSEMSSDSARVNALRAEAMLIMTSIIRVGQSQFVKTAIDEDSIDRIINCVKSLAEFEENKGVEDVFLKDTRSAFTVMLTAEEKKRSAAFALEKEKTAAQADDLINIRHLARKNHVEPVNELEQDLSKATGAESKLEDVSSKLGRVVQLTGFSDPIYAEAYVKVHQFDIVLDILLVNQTSETLQNLSVEFATLGDLKIVERPTTQNIGPHSFYSVQATVKVSSTDTGVIFGNIVYDGPAGAESNIVILNHIHADIMDYIKPSQCTESQFRSMWTEFEWENKVNLNSKGANLREFLAHLMKNTNMACLTPEASLEGDCGFLSANLYARSLFGEDALANLSIEQDGDGPITGHVRIRSKGQGVALSLGDRIAAAQRLKITAQ
ncbi:Coatomer, beta subunit [Saitoella complicata NRRL Y-17804]|nr:Coatomer, beta subunit [Saitoella complicata NRRL Y-17804]ODQ56039.1 Coatomer, beta subunit [Saitoella complicata NRRL Y-17804]